MRDVIDQVAGKIWHYLNDNGEASINKLVTDTGLSKNDILKGVGWLAKEDKLNFNSNGRVETLSLK